MQFAYSNIHTEKLILKNQSCENQHLCSYDADLFHNLNGNQRITDRSGIMFTTMFLPFPKSKDEIRKVSINCCNKILDIRFTVEAGLNEL